MSKGNRSFWRWVFNFPEKDERPKDASRPGAGADSAELAGAWSGAARPDRSIESGAWAALEQESSGRRFLRRFMRGAVFVLILLLCWIGIRTIIQGSRPPAAAPVPAELQFPDAPAVSLAERFAEAYYTWSQDDIDARTTAVARDFGGTGADDRFGWDGQGKQIAVDAHTVALEISGKDRAAATVTLLITPYEVAKGGEWEKGETYPQTVQIPLGVSEGRVVVSDLPAIVAEPQVKHLKSDVDEFVDQDLTLDTREQIRDFWQRYGEEEDLSSVSAPGATFRGLGGTATFDNMADWRVLDGGKTHRQARATVEWVTTSGAKLKQHYALEIVRVTTGDTDRWQVLSVESDYE